jgi:hypothetical protein
MANYEFPVEVIDLPSRGKGYATDNPLSKGSIELKYMTAKEEDILASQNLIKKGIVLDKLFESVVVSKDVNLNDILIGDKNAILLATRLLGYGKDYKVQVTDPFTGELQDVTIDLSKIQIKEIDFDKLNTENEYEFELPISKKKIKFKLLNHGDETKITQEVQALSRLNKDKDAGTSEISTRLRHMIVEVEGSRDAGTINNFVKNQLLARDSKSLREYVKTISPDLDLRFVFTSDITGEQEALDIPFGVSFFYPSE